MKKLVATIFMAAVLLASSVPSYAQTKNDGGAEVKKVLSAYKAAIEALDASNTVHLFAKDSKVFESGGVEGTYSHYLEHHLAPEFKAFKSFTYSDYKADVQVDGAYAFATETYLYTIVSAKDGAVIKRRGVTTSILKNTNGNWQIVNLHSSARGAK